MATATKKYLVVTTQHRGVFGGYGTAATDGSITLTEARMCVSWTADIRGVLGLAASGPSKSCRITPAVPKITLSGITSVMECSPEAKAAWERGPWS